jgi:TPP-dependent indolepyruvate ferredoxin oxidoreductase alpha subunit
LVTGYPGAPVTAVVNGILALTSPDEVQVEWASNEKVAIEMALGLHPDHPLLLRWLAA